MSQVAKVRPQAMSIPDGVVFRPYEDSSGDIWISTVTDGHLLRWERATEKMHDFKGEVTSGKITHYGSCFAEDKSGELWIGSQYDDSLMRYKDAHIEIKPTRREKSVDGTNTLYFDHLGRLWMPLA